MYINQNGDFFVPLPRKYAFYLVNHSIKHNEYAIF